MKSSILTLVFLGVGQLAQAQIQDTFQCAGEWSRKDGSLVTIDEEISTLRTPIEYVVEAPVDVTESKLRIAMAQDDASVEIDLIYRHALKYDTSGLATDAAFWMCAEIIVLNGDRVTERLDCPDQDNRRDPFGDIDGRWQDTYLYQGEATFTEGDLLRHRSTGPSGDTVVSCEFVQSNRLPVEEN